MEVAMTADEWLERFAGLIGAEKPSEQEIERLLDLAATAAHASERTAAPIACYMAGRSGRDLAQLQETAGQVG
jgi:hypothetical protein